MSAPHTEQLGSGISPHVAPSTVWAQATSRGVWLHSTHVNGLPRQVSVLLNPHEVDALATFLTEHGTATR